jgi:Uncharacterised nucleotidyltransferase
MNVHTETKIENPATAVAAVKLLLGSAVPARLAMQGTSMLPLLREPMVLELAPITGNTAVGDVIVFESEGRLIAHRVTARLRSGIETCGDARPWSPEHPPEHSLVGKVVTVRANASLVSPRIDSGFFWMRGKIYGHTRRLRALPFQLRAFAERIFRALPWRRERIYAALVDAMAAILQGDRKGLEIALAHSQPESFAAVAQRHGCSAMLLEGLSRFGTFTEQGLSLRRILQAQGRNIVLLSLAARTDLIEVATALSQRSIDFALLKGAARLYRGELGAYHCGISDLDILVPPEQLENAIAALRDKGYDERHYAKLRDHFRTRHHHVAPLFPPRDGFAVELHTSLAPPGTSSTVLDWRSLNSFMERVAGPAGEMLCLNRLGKALHLAIHAVQPVEWCSLRDTVLLAVALKELSPSERQSLLEIVRSERIDCIRLGATVAFAARLAKITWPTTPQELSFLRWAVRREDIPLYLYARSRFLEGLHAGSIRLAWDLLAPPALFEEQPSLNAWRRIFGRAAAGLCALAYSWFMKSVRFDEEQRADTRGSHRYEYDSMY